MESDLKLFYDAVSQPSRAVWLLLETNKIPFKLNLVNIAKGDNKDEKFLRISPNGTVPAIDDNGYYLFESSAIMKYIVSKYKLPDHWYPRDMAQKAKIDEYLSWHSSNLRLGAATFLFLKYIGKNLMGMADVHDEKMIQDAEKLLHKSIDTLENYFLKRTMFISSNEISIADIQAVCEFTQFWLVGIDVFKDKPRLQQWLKECQNLLDPHFDKVHSIVYKIRDKGVFKSKL